MAGRVQRMMTTRSHQGLPAAAGVAFVLLLSSPVGARASGEGGKSSSHWTMFRGNPALTGVASGTLPDKPAPLWSFKTARPVKSSAAIVEGRVFIGSDDAKLYALNLAGGKKLW